MLLSNTLDAKVSIGSEFVTYSEGQLPANFKLDKARAFGSHSLSYSAAVQGDLKHFANQDGYLAFQKKLGHVFVLGDPVIAPRKTAAIVDAFLTRHANVTFCQVSELTADLLNQRKYWINELGIDTLLPLDSFDFFGKSKERFRYAENWLKRRDFRVVELQYDAAILREVQALCETWRRSRILKKETAFLNRPLVYSDEPEVRRFFLLDNNDKIQAFVFFDPLYRDGQVAGYVTTFKRRLPDAPSMAESGICKVAIEKFKSEGRRWVRLGLSPFAEISDNKFRYNWILKTAFKYYFRAGWTNRFMFNLRGHAEFKKRFRGTHEKMYFASPSWINDVRFFALMRLSKFI